MHSGSPKLRVSSVASPPLRQARAVPDNHADDTDLSPIHPSYIVMEDPLLVTVIPLDGDTGQISLDDRAGIFAIPAPKSHGRRFRSPVMRIV